ncbi:MAG: hypothetical protein KatS3mg115_1824 [Candidatus Poribacteria bacterium]|nr:MAG: hypothetical protein KatS3mg115_1824 [Candidatus Poribacteria bacterium]
MYSALELRIHRPPRRIQRARTTLKEALPPSFSMSWMTICRAPSLMETIANTDATPMVIPNSVRKERSLFSKMARKPCATDSRIPIADPLASERVLGD